MVFLVDRRRIENGSPRLLRSRFCKLPAERFLQKVLRFHCVTQAAGSMGA